ncbi:MAG: RnfH family protein [Betaproteobacteria bacterium]|nr:RnfH family protein [Betaproteobacteria bacterium]
MTVAWASPRAQGLVEVDLPPGATVADAVAAARAVERAGVEPGLVGFAIFGQTARPGTPVADGDRVEITRPLVADPRAARRDRAAAHPLPPGAHARSGRRPADGRRPTGGRVGDRRQSADAVPPRPP